MTSQPTDPAAAARFLNTYARRFHAGAFATPTAAEIDRLWKAGRGWHWWEPGVAAVGRRLTRDSLRRDFTGRRMRLPAGTHVITHLAAAPHAALPNLDRFDWIFAYIEDQAVTAALIAQGRQLAGVRISAASEIIGCWGKAGTGHTYPPADAATLVQLRPTVSPVVHAAVLSEVTGRTDWHDDFPYYSDGSWGAVNLRGFNPADPTYGIKPAEMSRAWWAEHPEAAQYTSCEWTVAAARCPTLVDITNTLVSQWGGQLERVRLLRMAGRGGKTGRLARHTDITDRAAGTADGQIIRLHVPLVTHPAITMTGWNLAGQPTSVHLPAWTVWYLDARKPHAVDNPAGIDRIHLVIDVTATPAARAAITAGTDHARPTPAPATP